MTATMLCPPLSVLLLGELDARQQEHVSSCLRCQVLLANQPKGAPAEESSALSSETAEAAVPLDEIRRGSLALVGAPDADEHLIALVLKVTETEATVAPVSAETRMATDWDLILDSSVLSYLAIAEVWNYGNVLVEQFRDVVAQAPAEVLEQALRMLRASLASAPVPVGFPVGPAVLSDIDPRLLFQEEEAETARLYWEPVMMLAGISSVPELIDTRSEELSLSRAELGAAVEGRFGWLGQLESRNADLRRVLKAGELAALMRLLAVPASKRLGEIVRATIETAPKSPEDSYASVGVLARSRATSWSPKEPELPSPDAYVAEFLRALSD